METFYEKIDKYLENQLSEKERKEFEQLLKTDDVLRSKYDEYLYLRKVIKLYGRKDKLETLKRYKNQVINEDIKGRARPAASIIEDNEFRTRARSLNNKEPIYSYLKYAAVVLLLVSVSIYILTREKTELYDSYVTSVVVKPGEGKYGFPGQKKSIKVDLYCCKSKPQYKLPNDSLLEVYLVKKEELDGEFIQSIYDSLKSIK